MKTYVHVFMLIVPIGREIFSEPPKQAARVA